MNRSSARILIFGLITLLITGFALQAAATVDDETTGWVITGPDAFGGNYIINGTTNVGALNANTNAGTSPGGNDYVTLLTGGTASTGSGVTIEFTHANNVFVNYGTVEAPNYDKAFGSFANTAVAYCSGTGIYNQLLTNYGDIYGGNGMPPRCIEVADTAVAFYSNDGIFNIDTTNAGLILGGNDSTCTSGSTPPVVLGSGIVLYDTSAPSDINGVLIGNSNTISGGSDLKDANVLGTAVALVSEGNVTNVEIVNSTSGVITGGSNNSNGFINGSAVVLMASPTGSGSLSNVLFNNAGEIVGGKNANNESLTSSEGSMVGNVAGSGVVFWGGDGVTNLSITNSGYIAGGNCAYGGEGDCYFGSVAGTGLAIFDKNNSEEPDISNVSLANSGEIIGGNESEYAYIVGSGVGIVGLGNVLNLSITNTSTGLIEGGNNNYGEDGEYESAVVGTGLGIVAGNPYEDDSENYVSGVLITNNGKILGGNCNEEGVVVGSGIGISATNGVYGVAIGNSGTIAGGNNNEYGTIVGNGIGIYDNNGDGKDIDGVAIYNSGLIIGGTGNRYADMTGVGIGILGEGNVTNILVDNAGSIAGGNGNNPEDADFAGEGLLIASYSGTVSNVEINNYAGSITGGNGVGREAGANGIDIEADKISNLQINNYAYIAGGNGGNGMVGCENDYGYDGGAGIYVDASRCDPDFNLYNAGLIVGGNGGIGTSGGGNGGAGVFLDLGMGIDAKIDNYGAIYGGNAGPGGTAGQGIQTIGNNIAINNYGFVSAGSGAVEEGLPAGYPAVAISVDGTGNSVSLWNHSSVHGTIQGLSSGNNFLNLDFTGVSSAAKTALVAQLESPSQPVPWGGNGTNFAGTFTFRGVEYYVDPLILNVTTSSYAGQGITINQIAIGANLNSLPVNPTGPLLALYNAIDASGNVPAALEALNPERYQIYGDIAQADATFMALSIDERLNNLRDGSESIDISGMGGGSSETTTAGYDKDGKTVVVPDQKSMQKQWGFFAQGGGLFTNIDGHGGDLSDAGFTSSGLMLGVDGKVGENWVVGLLFDYTATTANLDNLSSSADVQSLSGGAYAGYHNGPWYANGLAAYGSNTYNATRDIIFPGFNATALSNTDGNQEEVNIDGGYDYHLNDKLTVGPLLGLQYVNLNVDGFNEVGGGAADLAVGGWQVDSLRSRLGFRANYHTQIAKEVAFATDVHAEWQHEFLDNSYLIGSDFIGSGLSPFGVETTSPQRDSALVGVSANFTVRNRMTLFFDYDVQAGQQSYLEQSVKGGLKFSF